MYVWYHYDLRDIKSISPANPSVIILPPSAESLLEDIAWPWDVLEFVDNSRSCVIICVFNLLERYKINIRDIKDICFMLSSNPSTLCMQKVEQGRRLTGITHEEKSLVTVVAQFRCPVTIQQHITDCSNVALVGWPRHVAIALWSRWNLVSDRSPSSLKATNSPVA